MKNKLGSIRSKRLDKRRPLVLPMLMRPVVLKTKEKRMKKAVLALILLCAVNANAEAQYYIKTKEGFKSVSKTDAVLTLIQKRGEVLSCRNQYLTSKLTLKNENNESKFGD